MAKDKLNSVSWIILARKLFCRTQSFEALIIFQKLFAFIGIINQSNIFQ